MEKLDKSLDKDYIITELKKQIFFEQYSGSFYIDLMINHAIKEEHGDGYFQFVKELIKELKENSKDEKELNSNMKNLPGTIHEKIKNGELKDLLNL